MLPPISNRPGKRRWGPGLVFTALCGVGLVLASGAGSELFCSVAWARQTDQGPVVVQPGEPGKPSRRLPPSTTGQLPPRSQAEVEFMQGMIMHHEQALEMTALIPSHTENKDLRLLGRIPFPGNARNAPPRDDAHARHADSGSDGGAPQREGR